MIEVANVTKTFGSGAGAFTALKDFGVTIRENEFFTLLGPSGCGKTTLSRTIAGFVDPTSGTVALDGWDILGDPPYPRPVDTVFLNDALLPHISVAENMGFSLELQVWPEAELCARVDQMMALVKITELASAGYVAEACPADVIPF